MELSIDIRGCKERVMEAVWTGLASRRESISNVETSGMILRGYSRRWALWSIHRGIDGILTRRRDVIKIELELT